MIPPRLVRLALAIALVAVIGASWISDNIPPHGVLAAKTELKSVSAIDKDKSDGQITIKVTLTSIAAGNVSVSLNSNRPSIIPVPDSVVVSAGSQSVTVNILTRPVGDRTRVVITAKLRSTRMSTVAVVWPPELAKVVLPGSEIGLGKFNLTIQLTSEAPDEGMDVRLYSTNPGVAKIPTFAHVPAGESAVTLQLDAVRPGTITVLAVLNGALKQATMRVLSSTSTPTNTPPPTETATYVIGTVQVSTTATSQPTGPATATETPTYVIGTVQVSTTASIEPTGQTTPSETPTVHIGTVEPSITASIEPTGQTFP